MLRQAAADDDDGARVYRGSQPRRARDGHLSGSSSSESRTTGERAARA